MVTKIAFLFPGQGSQFVGMGKDIYHNYNVSKDIYDKAGEYLGRDITKLCFESTAENLKQTINAQLAIVTTSIALLEAFRANCGIFPSFVAGHSLGEYSAIYSADVMDLNTTLKVVQKRSELMNTVNKGKMAAVIGANPELLEKALAEGEKVGYIAIANYNSPEQVVITGDDNAIKCSSEYLTNNGARKVIPLATSGAFHSDYLKDVSIEFENYISGININDAKTPVITNVDAQITTQKEDFRKKMPRQMYSSVYWTQTIKNMINNGVDTFVEIGAGRVLAGLNKKIAPELPVYNVYDKSSLEYTLKDLNKEIAKV
ncbi:MAG: ACP S-malonyltransferase [bacterium]|nr:ACP S-malonyltransferase [bacterium]